VFKNFNFLILLSILIISILGLTIVRSVAPELFISQLVFMFLCFLVFLIISFTDYRIFKNYFWLFYALILLLLVLPFVFGQVTRGAVRWIQIGQFTFQPSEIVKPLLVLFLAGFYTRYKIQDTRYKILSFALFLPVILLIFKQPDLGSSLVVLAIWVGILFAVGLNFKLFAVCCLLFAVCSPLVWRFLKDYQRARVLSFLNPYSDPLGTGYNVIQAVISVGSGKFFGRGLGRGTQSHLYFLPERHSDFIFASLAEELGFLGASLLLVFYFLLLFQILKIAKNAADDFGFLIVTGVFSHLSFQILVNIGMNLGLLPITGITLPLVSTGGSSLLATMVSLGLVENVGRSRRLEEVRIR